MNWNEVMELIIKLIIVPIIPLLAVYLKSLIQIKIAKAKREIEAIENETVSKQLDKQLDLAQKTLESCVTETTETYVSELKKLDKFDKNAQIIALNKSKEKFLDIISEATKEALEQVYGDYLKWIDTSIEKILESKKNK